MEFKLPDIGEGVAEGEIVKWRVAEGDAVREDQPLVEVMTDKATVEIPSPAKGVVKSILAAEGKVIPVGAVMVVIDEAGAAADVPSKAVSTHARAAVAAASAPAVAVVERPPTAAGGAVGGAAGGKVLATPATRRLARDLAIDITLVKGSGPRGRVTKDDVRNFADGKKAPAPPRIEETAPVAAGAPTGGREERIPFRGLRRKIAQRMSQSRHTAAHFTYVEECDMTELVQLRAKAKDDAEKKGIKLTYLPFLMKAIVSGLKEHPLLNASLDEERQEIVLKRYYNLGVATAAPEGLIVPVVRDCDRRGILDLARDVDRVSEEARQGKSRLEDLQGGTFTITSLGALGGVLATPIINYPEVAIVGVHKIAKRPVVRDDQVVVREIMNLSISLDHRVVDGAVGAAFLARVIRLLEDPKLLLLEGL